MADLVRKMTFLCDNIASSKTFLQESRKPFDEAKIEYAAAESKLSKVKKLRRDPYLELEKNQDDFYGFLCGQNRRDLRRYAKILNVEGLKCTNNQELYKYFVVKKYGHYKGKVYIDENNVPLLKTAKDTLKLNVSLITEEEQTSSFPSSSDLGDNVRRQSEMVSQMAEKYEKVVASRQSLPKLDVKYKKYEKYAKQKYISAEIALKKMKQARKRSLASFRGNVNKMNTLARKHTTELHQYASAMDKDGLLCENKLELFRYFVLQKFGGYKGKLFIHEMDESLIFRALNMELDVSAPPRL